MRQTSLDTLSIVRHKLRTVDWNHVLLLGLMLASLGILLVALLAWQLPYGNRLLLKVGDVAPFNVVAPRRLSYVSQVLTDRAREHAAQTVVDQYDSQEAQIRRQQVGQARAALTEITYIRNVADATLADKTDLLLEIQDLNLSAETAVQVLSLSDDEWRAVAAEVPLALDRVMRDEIRESTLPLVKRRVPLIVGGDLSEPANDVAIVLVQNLIRPNSILNVERTDQARAEARAQVSPQEATFEQGEIIIRSGDVASNEQVEALQELSKLQNEWDSWTLVRAMLFALLVLTILVSAIYRLRPEALHNYSELAMLLVVTVIWLLAAKFMVVNHPWLPYFYPLAALGILVAVLSDLRVAIIFVIAFALIGLYLSANNVAVVAYWLIGALAGILVVGRGERLNAFLWAAVAVALADLAVMAAFWAPFADYSSAMLVDMLMVVTLNGGLSAAIALIGYFVLGNLFGIITPLQLTELSRPTHPLLRQLLLKASGTYHHTILVSNLAERAAAAIGADALLVRVGAYYHDIGKTVRPYFFAENILDGSSPHEKLDPLTSAQIIISHVKDGVDLAQRYHLPDRIQDFIREHHGRSLVRYFYIQALHRARADEQVNEEDFRYPGPNPHSKETTIVLLADTCEAAVRAVRPASREELVTLVNRLIDDRVASGDLENSTLTFKDLQTIKGVFLQVLQGVHHPRIVYPEPQRAGGQATYTPGRDVAMAGDDTGQAVTERPAPGGIEESVRARPAPLTSAAAEG